MGDIWGGGVVKISNIFGVLEISETVDAGPEPTTEEKMRVPPPPPPRRGSNYFGCQHKKSLDADRVPLVIILIVEGIPVDRQKAKRLDMS